MSDEAWQQYKATAKPARKKAVGLALRAADKLVPPKRKLRPDFFERPESAARNPQHTILDLHGMTQAAAHAALSEFLATQYHHGTRQTLIITGKGLDGEGLLKRNLPHWCESPELNKFIDGISIAPPRLGGSGAFVVMLRRKN